MKLLSAADALATANALEQAAAHLGSCAEQLERSGLTMAEVVWQRRQEKMAVSQSPYGVGEVS